MEFDKEKHTYLRNKYPFSFDGKVLFNEASHSYGIVCDDTIVTDNIISVSSLFKDEDEEPDMDKIAMFVAKKFGNVLMDYLRFLRKRPKPFVRPLTYKERLKQIDGDDGSSYRMDYLSRQIYEKLEIHPGCDLKILSMNERMEVYGALLAIKPGLNLKGPDPKVEFVDWTYVQENIGKYKSDIPFPLNSVGVQKIWERWTEAGTYLHAYIEDKLNGIEKPEVKLSVPEIELGQAERLLSRIDGEVIRTELRMASLDHRICGTADALVRGKDGKLYIYDWKRSRNVFNPRKNMPGMHYVKYQRQLTSYRKLLRLNGVETEPIGVLGVIHPIYDEYQMVIVDLKELEDVVERKFKEREKYIQTIVSSKRPITSASVSTMSTMSTMSTKQTSNVEKHVEESNKRHKINVDVPIAQTFKGKSDQVCTSNKQQNNNVMRHNI